MKKQLVVGVGLLAMLLSSTVMSGAQANDRPACAFQTRGVVLVPNDLTLVDWPERAAKAGLTTVSLHHLVPSVVEKYVDSPEGKVFLDKCAKLGLEVEYELHAGKELLPRKMFAQEPDLFRMMQNGQRTPDANLCVHSARALEIAAASAVRIAKKLKPTTSRYYFWGDDGGAWCFCPKCGRYSDSEQALILENYLLGELRKVDPKATLAHLAYLRTIAAPKKVKPVPGIFLEFAPINRKYDKPFAQQFKLKDNGTLKALEENLAVFPVETAQVLEYWLDVSLFSNWRKPHVKLPWRPDVMTADAKTYAQLGIRHVTTFAVYIDADYVKTHGDPTEIQEYGKILQSIPALREYSVSRISKGSIKLDGRMGRWEWAKVGAEKDLFFPWEKVAAEPTVFKAATDGEFLYFVFDVKDSTPVVEKAFTNEMTVAAGDRVEIFMAPDSELTKYYCIEMGPLGHVLDYSASFYRKFDTNWNCPGLEVKTSQTASGYCVEGRIPLKTVDALGMPSLLAKAPLRMGLFRADYRHDAAGKVEEHWISWVDPKTETPDFHVPSAFGLFR